MTQSSFPVLSEITLDSIAENCRYEFGINKGDFEQRVFHAGGWLSRIRRGKSKMNDFYFQEMFKLLKSNSDSFVTTMKAWYPSLSGYTTETDIIEIVKANLAGTASVTSQAPIRSSLNINVCSTFLQLNASKWLLKQDGVGLMIMNDMIY